MSIDQCTYFTYSATGAVSYSAMTYFSISNRFSKLIEVAQWIQEFSRLNFLINTLYPKNNVKISQETILKITISKAHKEKPDFEKDIVFEPFSITEEKLKDLANTIVCFAKNTDLFWNDLPNEIENNPAINKNQKAPQEDTHQPLDQAKKEITQPKEGANDLTHSFYVVEKEASVSQLTDSSFIEL